ncbi:MAG: DNA gyrase/topoisomerase IV subunit A [Lachnospiraceae bacterium]|jgi:DNA gyrase subunit A
MSETIKTTEYSAEMQKSYINYSMSVITSRAVPDVRDGLKPVQRRVLYAMNELGITADKPHRKSARIVGDTMGKYHPHGDSSIYDALVVLAQDFKKNIPLVDGHGNFGSIEGDGAAAMRYTEARLQKFTQDVFLADLDKNVVDFMPNFDETEKEPTVLPVKIPNFLVNGSDGIAVGMVTSTPPHNLSEVIDAMEMVMDRPDCTTEDLMTAVKGPDFPTGGIVTNADELREIYETGQGKIRVRGKASFVPGKKRGEKDRIVISEIPYTMVGAGISKFLEDAAALAENHTLPDITDISNQSSKEGIRIVIELKKGADAEKILSGLYAKTKLEDTFGVNMLAIVDGRPEVLSLKRVIEEHLKFDFEIYTRKYTTLLEKEKAKSEVQEGLIRAVDVIDLIIEIIRGSRTLKMAKECLVDGKTEGIRFRTKSSEAKASKLHFTERQAEAILELRLGKLIGLEVDALMEEHRKSLAAIGRYEKILGSRKEMQKTIRADLELIRKNYSRKRRTEITVKEPAVFREEEPGIADAWFAMNRFGYVRLLEPSVFEKNEQAVREESTAVIQCTTSDVFLVFTAEGYAHQLKAADIPFAKLREKGSPVDNLCRYDGSKERMIAVFNRRDIQSKTLLMVTRAGMIRQIAGMEFNLSRLSFTTMNLSEGDELAAVLPASKATAVLVTDQKRAGRFSLSEIPGQKRNAGGVRTFKLGENEHIRSVYLLDEKEKLPCDIGGRTVDLGQLEIKKRNQVPHQYR